jgi:hypothetical protein
VLHRANRQSTPRRRPTDIFTAGYSRQAARAHGSRLLLHRGSKITKEDTIALEEIDPLEPSPRGGAAVEKSARLTGRVVAGSIALGLICVLAAVTLTSAPQTGQAPKIANPDRPLEKAPTQAATKRAR